MAENKTKKTTASVKEFISRVADDNQRKDSLRLIKLIKGSLKMNPAMWGPSIIGFGSYHYHYESGREGDMPMVGFSPRKAALVLYLSGFPQKSELLKKLGRHKGGAGCIYIRKLEEIDESVLKKMIELSVKQLQSKL